MAKILMTSKTKNPDNLMSVKHSIYHKRTRKYRNILIASIILNISLISYIILTTI